ncbi:hypothetical protein [Pseudomonas lurida]|uniref:hypothetical protein n=1 Tax=Pseudomonas lurida TaxID=244566 RepID=UPI001780E43A|nr:hypothetical protein [Pseudomonas lurida]MBD8671614.1 hypothetical protein [Pseudomonas lurida]
MRIRTEVISYNLNDRGRDFTGVDRKIDIEAAMRLINGQVLQESVKKGDIFGYVGHTFREKYGLDPAETQFEGGKSVVLEPAVRTVMIKAYPDGTLKHQQEFLDTAAGRIAARLYQSKAYGFSSVFYAPEINGLRTPKNFFGMDFVRNPNYDTNRGYDAMLDSASAGAMTGEGFAAEVSAMMDSVDSLLAANEAHVEKITDSYLHTCKINDELASANAKLLIRLQAYEKGGQPAGMLDSARPEQLERGHSYMPSRARDMLDSAGRFMAADLSAVTPQDTPEEKDERGFITKCRDTVNSILGTA